jgi:hypothetical protein
LRRKEEKIEEKRTTHKKNEKSKFFHIVLLHFIRVPKAVVEGERVNTERKREKERDRQRETSIASGGFRRFLSFSLNNKKKKRQKKRIREKF